jgi:MFS family permease
MDTAATTPRTAAGKPGFWINRDFALLWGGQTVSQFGDYIFYTTLVLWIAALAGGRSWGPLAVSGVLLASSLLPIAIRPFAGVFVDRWDTRRTMLRMDASRAALIALLLLMTGIVPWPFMPGDHLPLAW